MAAGARAVLDAAGSNAGIDSTDLGDSTAAQQLLQDLSSGATIGRHASDQIIPFAALASGDSEFMIPFLTEHAETGGWLASIFLAAGFHARERPWPPAAAAPPRRVGLG